MSKITSIAIKKDTYEMLTSIGKKNESYDDIIKKLLMSYKKGDVQ